MSGSDFQALREPMMCSVSLSTSSSSNFSLKDKDGKIHSLNDVESEFIVLYFYPKDNTPGCTIEAKEFTELLPKFKKLKTIIYGISKDSEKSHEKFTEKQSLKINLIPDEEHKIIEKYGAWQLKKFMGREFMGTLRTTFLVDKKGKVIKVWENVKARKHAQAVLDFIKEL
jgi:peroxiredoxin Q/BCP